MTTDVTETNKIVVPSIIAPSSDDLKTYFFVVFGYLDGLIPMRSFAEKNNKNSKPIDNLWVQADDDIVKKALRFAHCANRRQAAFYVIPGVVEKPMQARSSDILQMQTLLIDIDDGCAEEKLTLLEQALGKATLIVESGGISEEGHKKLHVYWQLSRAVSGSDLQYLLKLRHHIALSVGGDLHFKSAHQPIRVAGSVYHKNGECRLVKIRSYNPVEYELGALIDGARYLPTIDSDIASVNDSKRGNNGINKAGSPFTANLLTTKVHEGGCGEQTRFNHLTKVIGYWLRRCHDGLITEAEAFEEIQSYNLANVVPSWSYDKLKQSVNGLWKLHVEKYGEAKKSIKSDNKLIPINHCEWRGNPPEREWIIEDWLPRGYVTAIYGDGGVGKSLLAQQLMTCLSSGNDFLGKTIKPIRVYALMCEDDSNELWRRQNNINAHYNLKMAELNNIRLVSRVGKNNLLMTFNNSDVGNLTEFFDELYRDIIAYKPDLIILDTAADLFGGNENNRPQVRQFIQTACGSLARETGGAVLLCAHPSEGGIQKGTGSGGSTAWNNTVRSRWYLKRPEDMQFNKNHRVLIRVKSNYATTGEEEYLEWSNGVFLHLNSSDFSPRKTGQCQGEKNDSERDRRITLIINIFESEALKGNFYLMKQFAEKFQNYKNLGAKRTIYDDCSVAATQGLIKFFDNPKNYGLSLDEPKKGFGFVCTQNMKMPIGEVTNYETGEVEKNYTKILPTHFKRECDGGKEKYREPF